MRTESDGSNWLGFFSPFPQAVSRASVPHGSADEPIGAYLNPMGDTKETERTALKLWYDDEALHVSARCESAAMDRVRELARRETPYARDAWGDDALELQIDVECTKQRYKHIILPPNGIALTCDGFNNRQTHGWHPAVAYDVTLEDDAWTVEVRLPFELFGQVPREGDTWGFNSMRVNPSEPSKYVQWAPTFSDALRPELFGEITFGGAAVDRTADIDFYAQRATARKDFFFSGINEIQEDVALKELGMANWEAWGEYLANRTTPLPLRWDGIVPGKDGIPEESREMVIEMAETLVEQISGWSVDTPEATVISIEPLEALGDAYLLTNDPKYVAAFEAALTIHSHRLKQVLADVVDEHGTGLHYSVNPYHDGQIIRAEMLAYTYLNMRNVGLSPETHATMMWTVLRGGRVAAFNIATAYNYGNHQMYESGGLAAVAALFPEFPESDHWAGVASRSIKIHLDAELYPDGGYMERCGYHCVAMTFTMHAVATIQSNGVESRFPELMSRDTLDQYRKMHEWMLLMMTPGGRLPAFGDVGFSSILRFCERGSAVLSMPELAWPLALLAPEMIPQGVMRVEPGSMSVALDSDFTIMRDGWRSDSFFMAVDHGPLGGQHSHIDTVSFVACAFGHPIALDTGIGTSYEDPLYLTWFRDVRAHNVIAIADVESEKVAERTSWKPGDSMDVLDMHSGAYEAALGIRHDRRITFVKGVGWLILDKLAAANGDDLGEHNIDWILHTPYELTDEGCGVLHGAMGDGGLVILAGLPEELDPPVMEMKPASMPPDETLTMRQWDTSRHKGRPTERDITGISWRKHGITGSHCQFVTFLLPYHGERPDALLEQTCDGWVLSLNGQATTI